MATFFPAQRRSLIARGGVGALVVAGALTLAACGGGSGSATTTDTADSNGSTTPAANAANTAEVAKYTACLEKNGVTLPTRGADGPPGEGGPPPDGEAPPSTDGGTPPAPPGGNNAKFAKAQKACASLRPAGARMGGPGTGANSAEFAAFRNCLTLNGVKASEAGAAPGATQTAKVKKAMAACASLRPARTGQPPAATTTTATP